MSDEQGSRSASSDEYMPAETSSCSSYCEENGATGCYNNEPTYTKEELKQMGFDSDESDESDASDSDGSSTSSRLENLHWCRCQTCVVWENMTIYECKCCTEYDLLKNKLENIKCITTHQEFQTLCLNRIVLETAAIRHR